MTQTREVLVYYGRQCFHQSMTDTREAAGVIWIGGRICGHHSNLDTGSRVCNHYSTQKTAISRD